MAHKVTFQTEGGGKEKSFSVDLRVVGKELGVLGVRLVVGGSYIVTRSRVHFAACIDPVVFFCFCKLRATFDIIYFCIYTWYICIKLTGVC